MTTVKIIQPPALDHDAMMLKRFGQRLDANGKLERRIVANLCEFLKDRGFNIYSVWDGEEDTPANDTKSAMELLFNLDEARLYVGKTDEEEHNILFVFGNGEDVIADWSYFADDHDGFDTAMNEFDVENYL